MKIIKVILAVVLIVFLAGIFIYLNGADTSAAKKESQATEIEAKNKKTNEEHKILQDDKDSVVESNRALMEQISELKGRVNRLLDNQNKQKSKIVKVVNNKKQETKNIVDKVVLLVTKNLKKDSNNKSSSNDKGYRIGNTNNTDPVNQDAYEWRDAMRSGAFDKDGNYVPTTDTEMIEPVLSEGENEENTEAKLKLRPVYTIPPNSILSGKLLTGLLGRIPVDGQVTDPFRFSVKIIDKSFYANRHANNVLQDVIASGTASGDLLLSCVRATIDSITFIFEDGTISDHKISDIAELTNEYGYPCIKGELISNAAQYLGTTSILSGLSSAAKAIAEAQKTVTNNDNGNSTSSVTGSPSKLAAYSAFSGGVDDTKAWFVQRAKASFDVIFVPSGKRMKILTKEQVNIDYDPNGRKLDHQLATGGWNNETLD